MTRPASPAAASDLTDVRTVADAVAWLDQRATAYTAEAEHEPSPDKARGLRLAGSTLEVVAEVSRWWRDDVIAAEGLTSLARGYPSAEIAELPPKMRYYQLACELIGESLGQVAAQLTRATAPQRAKRAAVEASQRPAVQGRNL